VAGLDEYNLLVEANLRRLRLATAVVNEVHDNLIDPLYPHAKADLILQAEALLESSFALLDDVREMVWANQFGEPTPNS
jgi:hypothetical protein